MTEYTEIHRPQFHFTSKRKWINDPNGLVYFNGVWHLFFQHNIEANTWGPMWWGHAVSSDLLHWEQKDHALHPDKMGSMFSGSAVVDYYNTSGFGENAIILFYTAANRDDSQASYTQCMAYSLDNGVSWEKYANNPVVKTMVGEDRDPRVVWHEKTQQWIMALYLTEDKFCLLRSFDAKSWEKFQDIKLHSDCECPDFFSLSDNNGNEKWIFSGANGTYTVGSFDGELFTEESSNNLFEYGRNGYASQTWSNTENDRRIQISWMAGGRYPEMPFNQQLSFPLELTLKNINGKPIVHRWPIDEIRSLYLNTINVAEFEVSKGKSFIPKTSAKLFDVSFNLDKASSKSLYVVIRGHYLSFDWENNEFSMQSSGEHKIVKDRKTIGLPKGKEISVRLLVDKTSIEIFIDNGLLSGSFCFLPDGYINPIVFLSYSGTQYIRGFTLHELTSIWSD